MPKQNNNTSTVYHSAGFDVHPASGAISSAEGTQSVTLVNMKVLCVLLENSGEVVSRNTLFDEVWGDQVVSDDALTRSISDLRAHFARYSAIKLIETLPKRGYRWLPDVKMSESGLVEELQAAVSDQSGSGKPWPMVLSPGFISAVSIFLMLFLIAVIVSMTGTNHQEFTRLALMPVVTGEGVPADLEQYLEENLRDRLMQTQQLRFLSEITLQEYQDKPYAMLVADKGTSWVVEGTLRERENGIRMTLSLVDTRTSLVTYQKRLGIEGGNPEVAQFVDDFVSELEKLVSPD